MDGWTFSGKSSVSTRRIAKKGSARFSRSAPPTSLVADHGQLRARPIRRRRDSSQTRGGLEPDRRFLCSRGSCLDERRCRRERPFWERSALSAFQSLGRVAERGDEYDVLGTEHHPGRPAGNVKPGSWRALQGLRCACALVGAPFIAACGALNPALRFGESRDLVDTAANPRLLLDVAHALEAR